MNDIEPLRAYMQSQHGMSLATTDSDGVVHCCYVLYGFDDGWRLYFLSNPKTQHGQDIVEHSQVAGEIADTYQTVTDRKVGMSFTGEARLLSEREDIERAVGAWHVLNPGYEDVITVEKVMADEIQSKPFEIQLRRMKFFNEVLYGPEGVEVFEFD